MGMEPGFTLGGMDSELQGIIIGNFIILFQFHYYLVSCVEIILGVTGVEGALGVT